MPNAPGIPPAPSPERLLARSNARWASICRADWREAHGFLSPEKRELLSLEQYAAGKQLHHYADATPGRVLHADELDGYLVVTVLWTPVHPRLQEVLKPGQTLSQRLQMFETWRWAGDDWYFVLAERADDFRVKHPELDVR